MTIGIKFCGGCNPRHDRGKVLEGIKDAISDDVDFVNATQGGHYDILLVIGGCANNCASIDEYDYDNLVNVWDDASLDGIMISIRELVKRR